MSFVRSRKARIIYFSPFIRGYFLEGYSIIYDSVLYLTAPENRSPCFDFSDCSILDSLLLCDEFFVFCDGIFLSSLCDTSFFISLLTVEKLIFNAYQSENLFLDLAWDLLAYFRKYPVRESGRVSVHERKLPLLEIQHPYSDNSRKENPRTSVYSARKRNIIPYSDTRGVPV